MKLSPLQKVIFREFMKELVVKKINEFMDYDAEENHIKDIKFNKGYLSELIMEVCIDTFEKMNMAMFIEEEKNKK